MQVPHPNHQHAVMIEAVENHMPEVIIVDEIGTEAETIAARTIAERGVQLIGTAHGNTLENLVMNPTLSDLVGGVQTVTLGDEEARFRGTQKTVRERKNPPTFDIVVEIVDHDEVILHRDAAAAVDMLLRDVSPEGEHRSARTPNNESPAFPTETVEDDSSTLERSPARQDTVRIYPYALSRDLLARAIRDLRLDARMVNYPEQADMIVALRARAGDHRLERLAAEAGIPLHLVKKNTTAQLRLLLQNVFYILEGVEDDEVSDAVREAEQAIQQVNEEGIAVELAPRRPALRKLQHKLAARHHLLAESAGSEPLRHLVIYPR
jgi:hypothetical protein